MTTIKCRYKIPYCSCDKWMGGYEKVDIDTNGFCDSFTSNCQIDAEYILFDDCEYSWWGTGEFEKTVKCYEYDDEGVLTVGRKKYMDCQIDYLEIDGRILKEGDTDADSN